MALKFFKGFYMATTTALDTALGYIEAHYMEQVTLEDLIRVSGVSKFCLTRQFKKKFDTPPQRWIWCFRVFVAKHALTFWPELSCRDIAFACGFETPAHFSRVFKTVVGETPQSFKKRQACPTRRSDHDISSDCGLSEIAKRAFLSQEKSMSGASMHC